LLGFISFHCFTTFEYQFILHGLGFLGFPQFTFGNFSGSEIHLGQFLRGQLAELTIVNNDTETDHVIGCINSCREKIDFHAISEMDTGMVCSHVDPDH